MILTINYENSYNKFQNVKCSTTLRIYNPPASKAPLLFFIGEFSVHGHLVIKEPISILNNFFYYCKIL